MTAVMNSSPTVENDGAACFTAPSPIPILLATDKTGSTPFNQQLTVPAGSGLLVGDTGRDITVTSYTQPTNGTVVVNPDGSYTYTPNSGFSGSDTFTYTITDAFDMSATASVTITVSAAAVTNNGSLASTGTNMQSYGLFAIPILLLGIGMISATARHSKTNY